MSRTERSADAGPAAIRTRGLTKRYGAVAALGGVDMVVPEGAVYVLVGPNGAGKSTTLKVLLDLVVADSGSAEVLGLDTRRDGPRVRAQIGYVPERQDSVYGWMRVRDMLAYHAAYYAGWDAGYTEELSRLFELRPEARFGQLSKGQQRRVQLLLALAHHPPVLLLDEPTDGLDPVMRDEVLSALAGHLARFPTTIVVSTHQVHEPERLADRLGVMRAGRIEAELDRDAIRRRLRAYRIELPAAWAEPEELRDAVLRRTGMGREVAWTILGDEADVAARLRSAGAVVRSSEPLTLADAALALLQSRAASTQQPERSQPIPAGV